MFYNEIRRCGEVRPGEFPQRGRMTPSRDVRITYTAARASPWPIRIALKSKRLIVAFAIGTPLANSGLDAEHLSHGDSAKRYNHKTGDIQ